MMRKARNEADWRIALCLAVGFAVASPLACDDDGGDAAVDAAGAGAVEPSPASEEIWESLDDYQAWPTFHDDRHESDGHAGFFVLAHFNDVADRAMDEGRETFPDGAIFAKDNFASRTDEEPAFVTLMAKRSGQWYWMKARPDGHILQDDQGTALEGFEVGSCIRCHEAASDSDWVFGYGDGGPDDDGNHDEDGQSVDAGSATE